MQINAVQQAILQAVWIYLLLVLTGGVSGLILSKETKKVCVGGCIKAI